MGECCHLVARVCLQENVTLCCPLHSILRHALDKIAEIKSLLEERRIGEDSAPCWPPPAVAAVERRSSGRMTRCVCFIVLCCSCQDCRCVQ